jgi:hypothetical protein
MRVLLRGRTMYRSLECRVVSCRVVSCVPCACLRFLLLYNFFVLGFLVLELGAQRQWHGAGCSVPLFDFRLSDVTDHVRTYVPRLFLGNVYCGWRHRANEGSHEQKRDIGVVCTHQGGVSFCQKNKEGGVSFETSCRGGLCRIFSRKNLLCLTLKRIKLCLMNSSVEA